ncbi:hypothetical protein DYB35_010279, partial [Aphanomyces astaci]
ELETKVSSIHHTHKRWKLLWNDVGGSPTNKFPRTTEDLKKEVASAERSLGFLEQSIRAIESDRTKYAHIDRVELSGRKAFELMSISAEVSSDAVKARVLRDERRSAASSPTTTTTTTIDRNAILVDEKARQQQIVQDQDENLDQLHTTVSRLGHVAVDINAEIKTQNRCLTTTNTTTNITAMLEDMEMDVDDTQERMNFVMTRMSRLLKTKGLSHDDLFCVAHDGPVDTCQLGGILMLTGVLIVLVFLVIYT